MVLGEVLVTISVVDRLSYVTDGQVLTGGLAILVVLGPTVGVEVGRFMDKRSSLGICTSVGGAPEGTAEVDPSKSVGI